MTDEPGLVSHPQYIGDAEEWADYFNSLIPDSFMDISEFLNDASVYNEICGLRLDRNVCNFIPETALLVSQNHWFVLRWDSSRGWYVVEA